MKTFVDDSSRALEEGRAARGDDTPVVEHAEFSVTLVGRGDLHQTDPQLHEGQLIGGRTVQPAQAAHPMTIDIQRHGGAGPQELNAPGRVGENADQVSDPSGRSQGRAHTATRLG